MNTKEPKTKKIDTVKWTNPRVGLGMVIFATIALYSSFGLLASELCALKQPNATLSCDVNPLVGCSESIHTPQAHLFFNLPNSAIGLFVFAALLGIAAILLFGGGLPRLIWWGMAAGMAFGLFYVGYFLYVSIRVFGALCPFCLCIWFAIMGTAPLVWFSGMSAGAFGLSNRRLGKSLLRYWWAITLLLCLIVVLIVVVTMPDKISLLFGCNN